MGKKKRAIPWCTKERWAKKPDFNHGGRSVLGPRKYPSYREGSEKEATFHWVLFQYLGNAKFRMVLITLCECMVLCVYMLRAWVWHKVSFLDCSLHLYFETGSLIEPQVHWVRKVDWHLRGSACFHLFPSPCWGYRCMSPNESGFTCVLELDTQFLMLAQQTLYWVSPDSKCLNIFFTAIG